MKRVVVGGAAFLLLGGLVWALTQPACGCTPFITGAGKWCDHQAAA
jgi:hypothetical protein